MKHYSIFRLTAAHNRKPGSYKFLSRLPWDPPEAINL